MSHALAPPRLPIDAKRIIATSGAIAMHVGILMMLMMPPAAQSPVAHEDIVVPNWEKPKELPPPPPPPKPEKPQPVPQHVDPKPIPIVEQPPIIYEDQAVAIDAETTIVPEVVPSTFDAAPATSSFQQLAVAVGTPPVYPRPAIQRGIEGTVMLRVHVDASGNPIEVSIEHSSGSRILDEAALKHVKARWKFVPAQSNGQAVEAWGLVPVEYVLQ